MRLGRSNALCRKERAAGAEAKACASSVSAHHRDGWVRAGSAETWTEIESKPAKVYFIPIHCTQPQPWVSSEQFSF